MSRDAERSGSTLRAYYYVEETEYHYRGMCDEPPDEVVIKTRKHADYTFGTAMATIERDLSTRGKFNGEVYTVPPERPLQPAVLLLRRRRLL